MPGEQYDNQHAAELLRPVAELLRATPRHGPSFAQALDSDERAQADARAATAEQERDDILHDLRQTKADRDRLDGLLREAEYHITRLEHRHLTASNRADKAIASRRQLLGDLDALTRALGRQTNEMDRLQQQRDRLRRRLIAAAPIADHAHRTIRAIRAARAHTCDQHCTEGGCDFDLSGFVDQVDAILLTTPEMPKESIAIPVLFDRDPDCGCTPPCGHGAYRTAAAGLGSSRRAQDGVRCICPVLPGGPLVQSERDPDCAVHGQDARPAQDGYAQGYAEAVARLRDDARYGNWWSSSPESLRPTQPIRGHLADYLETVGPDGPDVERPVRRPAAELERLLAGMLDRDIQPEPTDPVGTAAVDTALRALDAFLTVVNAATQWRTGWADDAGQTMPHSQIRDLIVAVDELLASWPGMDLSVPAVSIAEVAAETTIPTTPGAYHWGRAWAPSDIEANCPCPKAPCGYVVRDQESPDCDQHSGNRTMRGGHSAERCAEDRP